MHPSRKHKLHQITIHKSHWPGHPWQRNILHSGTVFSFSMLVPLPHQHPSAESSLERMMRLPQPNSISLGHPLAALRSGPRNLTINAMKSQTSLSKSLQTLHGSIPVRISKNNQPPCFWNWQIQKISKHSTSLSGRFTCKEANPSLVPSNNEWSTISRIDEGRWMDGRIISKLDRQIGTWVERKIVRYLGR